MVTAVKAPDHVWVGWVDEKEQQISHELARSPLSGRCPMLRHAKGGAHNH
jgi:hypothetical protein